MGGSLDKKNVNFFDLEIEKKNGLKVFSFLVTPDFSYIIIAYERSIFELNFTVYKIEKNEENGFKFTKIPKPFKNEPKISEDNSPYGAKLCPHLVNIESKTKEYSQGYLIAMVTSNHGGNLYEPIQASICKLENGIFEKIMRIPLPRFKGFNISMLKGFKAYDNAFPITNGIKGVEIIEF